jgi:hypothetical protein
LEPNQDRHLEEHLEDRCEVFADNNAALTNPLVRQASTNEDIAADKEQVIEDLGAAVAM